MDPEISQKLAQKWNQIHVNLFLNQKKGDLQMRKEEKGWDKSRLSSKPEIDQRDESKAKEDIVEKGAVVDKSEIVKVREKGYWGEKKKALFCP